MFRKFLFPMVLASGFTLAAQAQPPAGFNPEDAMNALSALMGGGGAATNQTIHFRQLKELLPAEYMGMKRSNAKAGKNAAFGMNISYAEAGYAGDGKNISIKVQDISAMGQFMRMAQFAWAANEMEEESDDGYERTTKVDGYAAMESYRYRNKSGELQIMVDDRFIVEVSGYGIEMEDLKGLLDAVDLKKLATMKPEAN